MIANRIKNLIIIFFLLFLWSCATMKKVDKSYLIGSQEMNPGEKVNYQIQIEKALYKLKKDPSNWRIKNNLMVLYRKVGNHQEAIRYGRSILHSDTKNYIALKNLAMVYYELKNYKYSGYLLKKAIDIYDEDPGAHVNFALVLFEKGEPVLAEEELLLAIKYNKDFYPAIKNLAIHYFETHNYRKASKHLKIVVKNEPTIEHKNMLALSYRHLERYKDAYSLYNDVLNKDRKNKIALFNSAIIELDHLNKPSQALRKFKKIKEMEGRSPSSENMSKIDKYINKAVNMKMLEESR